VTNYTENTIKISLFKFDTRVNVAGSTKCL